MAKRLPDSSDLPRLMARVVEADTGCLEWRGTRHQTGYGYVHIGGIYRSVHRAMWIIHHGVITSDQHVCHRCDNRACINVDHLFLGNQDINMKDMAAKGRRVSGENVWNATLTEEMVRLVREAKSRQRAPRAQYGVAEMAKKFGVKRSALYGAASGSRWKHVKDQAP